METYLPDASTRVQWERLADEERYGKRAAFWRETPPAPERPADGHKGTFGTALAVGGSRGMSGAIALCGAASLVSGSGLTQLMVPDAILETVAQFQREYTTIPCASDASGRLAFRTLDSFLERSKRATAVAVGPGLGRSDELDSLVPELFFELEKPSVFDADALNALAEVGALTGTLRRRAQAPCVLTPHPGEFARLTGCKPTNDRSERIEAARSFARRCSDAVDVEVVVVLKGSGTVVSDGRRCFVNETGNANLATGGSGDVLTGVILGLLAQGLSALDAARVGVALHGLAAELRATICSRGGIASDVVRFLPSAFDYYERARA